jgi:hypothetical protein
VFTLPGDCRVFEGDSLAGPVGLAHADGGGDAGEWFEGSDCPRSISFTSG